MPEPRFRTPWPALALLALGTLGFAAAWILLGSMRNAQSSWMAVPAALDAALMLRLGRMSPGHARAACAMVATACTILLANWGIAAAQIGKMLGLLPWESALRIGNDYAWNLILLANTPIDIAWFCAGLLIAAIAAR